jgi:hypothetical protein
MEKLNVTPAMKLTERYDQQLLALLSEDLKSVKPVSSKLLVNATFNQPFHLAS